MPGPIDNRPNIAPPTHAVASAPAPAAKDPAATLLRLLDDYATLQGNPQANPLQLRASRSMLTDEVAKQHNNGTLDTSVGQLPLDKVDKIGQLLVGDQAFHDEYLAKLTNKFADDDLTSRFVAGQAAPLAEGTKNVAEVLQNERQLRGESGTSARGTGSDPQAMVDAAASRLMFGGADADGVKQTLGGVLDDVEAFIKKDLRGKKKPKALLDELQRARENMMKVNIEAEGLEGITANMQKVFAKLDKSLTPAQRDAYRTRLLDSARSSVTVPSPEAYAKMSPREQRAALNPKVLDALPADVKQAFLHDLSQAQVALDQFTDVRSTADMSDLQKAKVGDSFQSFASSSVGPIMSEEQIAKLPEAAQARAREFNTERQQYMRKAEQTHSEIMSLLNSNLPIEMIIFLVMALFANQSEEKLKLKMKEMAFADQMERSGGQVLKDRAQAAGDPNAPKDTDGPVASAEEAGILMKSSTQLNQEVQAAMTAFSQMSQALAGLLRALQDMASVPVRNIR